MDENYEGYQLLRGVRNDVKILLTSFEQTESVRFRDFCTEWRKLNFSTIFCKRKTVAELLEFTEEIISIVKEHLRPPFTFHRRVGALFTLYGLYSKQLLKGVTKIRFTKDEWQDLLALVQECKNLKHHDIVFIFYKLYLTGAYVFTIVPRATGLESGCKKYGLKNKMNKSTPSDALFRKTDIVEEDDLDELDELEKSYFDMKAKILKNNNLKFTDGDFASQLKRKLSEFYETNKRDSEVATQEDVAMEAGTSEMVTREAQRLQTIYQKQNEKESTKGGRPRKRQMESGKSDNEAEESTAEEPMSLPEV